MTGGPWCALLLSLLASASGDGSFGARGEPLPMRHVESGSAMRHKLTSHKGAPRKVSAEIQANGEVATLRSTQSARTVDALRTGFFGSPPRRRRSRRRRSSSIMLTRTQADMFSIADDIYNDESDAERLRNCWLRDPFLASRGNWDPSNKDHIAIYTCICDHCQDTCAVAFEGSDKPWADVGDWVNNFNPLKGEFCGMTDLHRGFVDELSGMLSNPEWNSQFKPKLQQCQNLYSVGHSLGGAVATLFAACVNCPTCEKPEALQGILAEVHLYTAGAPPVAYDRELTNGMASDGIFKGLRAWNHGLRAWWTHADLVAAAPSHIGLQHPKIESIGMSDDPKHVIDIKANDPAEGTMPFTSFSPIWKWSVSEHQHESYADRAVELENKS